MRRKRMVAIILIILILALGVDFIIIRHRALKRFAVYEAKAKTVNISYGRISYIDEGKGEPVLICHGICGGYDQGFDVLKNETDHYRVIAPSRFGYPGSDMPEDASIDMQVEAFVELLDELKIDKTYVLGTSAGGTPAIRFALVHPERCKGLILYCSGYPEFEKPTESAGYAGPPAAVCNDFCMWMISPLFGPIMGMESSTINEILPMKDRKSGIIFDGEVTNTDKTNNFENYDMRKLTVPILMLHSKDDKLAEYEPAEKWSKELKDCTFVSFPDGGHMMMGHEEEVKKALHEFTEE